MTNPQDDMTSYTSEKPKRQKTNKDSPPFGSTSVFNWRTFKSLQGDFSDKRLTEVFKRISEDVIERPYHYDPHWVVKKDGSLETPPFKQAGNSEPPKKDPDVAVYKQNHGTGHSLRQAMYTRALLDKIAKDGNQKGKSIASKINNNSELKSALELAAYCKRIGRTLDYEHDHGGITIYSQRSADMFAKMAEELGYNKDLIKIIHDSMLERDPPGDPVPEGIYADMEGINGSELRNFTHGVLLATHVTDLTRLFKVRRCNIEGALRMYFDPPKLKEVSKQLVEMGCEANARTGNPVVQQGQDIAHKPQKANAKRLIEVVQNIPKTMSELAEVIKFPTPTTVMTHAAPAKPVFQNEKAF